MQSEDADIFSIQDREVRFHQKGHRRVGKTIAVSLGLAITVSTAGMGHIRIVPVACSKCLIQHEISQTMISRTYYYT
jgi:hypothetical protein